MTRDQTVAALIIAGFGLAGYASAFALAWFLDTAAGRRLDERVQDVLGISIR